MSSKYSFSEVNKSEVPPSKLINDTEDDEQTSGMVVGLITQRGVSPSIRIVDYDVGNSIEETTDGNAPQP